MQSSSEKRSGDRPWKPSTRRRALLALAGAVAVFLVVAGIWLSIRVDASLVESRLTAALREPLGAPRVEVREAGLTLFPPGIRSDGIRIQDREGAVLLHVGRAELRGVDLGALLRGDLRAGELRLMDPAVRYAPRSGRDGERASADPGRVPFERVVIRRGRLLYRPAGEGGDGASKAGHLAIWGLDASLSSDALAARLRAPARESGDGRQSEDGRPSEDGEADQDPEPSRSRPGPGLEVEAAGIRQLSTDGLTLLSVDSLELSPSGPTLSVESVRFAPTVGDPVLLRARGTRTRLALRTGRIRVDGFQAGELLQGTGWTGRTLAVDSPRANILVDKRFSASKGKPSWRPADGVTLLGRELRLAEVRVRGGAVRYAETPSGGSTPGEVRFEGISGTLRREGEESPTVGVKARALLQDEARLRTSLRLDPRARPLGMEWTGAVAPRVDASGSARSVDLRPFNEMLVPLEGIRLTSGRVDSLWFDVRVAGGRAGGSLTAVYRGLDYRLVSKESGDRGLGTWIKSLFAPSVLPSNPPESGGALRSGQVESELQPTQTFFSFLWASLRSGIVSLLGL